MIRFMLNKVANISVCMVFLLSFSTAYSEEFVQEIERISDFNGSGAGPVRLPDGQVWLLASKSYPYSFYSHLPKDQAEVFLKIMAETDAKAALVEFMNGANYKKAIKISMSSKSGTSTEQLTKVKIAGMVRGVTQLHSQSTETHLSVIVGVSEDSRDIAEHFQRLMEDPSYGLDSEDSAPIVGSTTSCWEHPMFKKSPSCP